MTDPTSSPTATSSAISIKDENVKPTIRTITAFLTLQPNDFEVEWGSLFSENTVEAKIENCVTLLREAEKELKAKGYNVQTLRIATNPFGEWMILNHFEADGEFKVKDTSGEIHQKLNPNTKSGKSTRFVESNNTSKKPSSMKFDAYGNRKRKRPKEDKLCRLDRMDQLLTLHNIDFCSVGPATSKEEAKLCPDIVSRSHRFSCSMVVEAGDVDHSNCAAETILTIAKLGNRPNSPKHVQGGLGNFRFCAASYCRPGIPFFPAARAESRFQVQGRAELQNGQKTASASPKSAFTPPIQFAIGLENGTLAQTLMRQCKSIANIRTQFKTEFAKALRPIQETCLEIAKEHKAVFIGIDSSLNPSLEATGSVASAIEELDEVAVFGGPGTLGAAAEITKALQSLPDIHLTGYCGLMLPVCEDTRLAELASDDSRRPFRISDLLSISSVCGVGVDTVPVAGDCTKEQLSSLILDVAGIAGRWNKSLSCRVFPVPEKTAGDRTEFQSPYMVNSSIFSVE